MKYIVKYTALAAVWIGTLATTGCDVPDACAGLPKPTMEQLKVATPPVEVEQPGRNGVDCELVDGRWQAEHD